MPETGKIAVKVINPWWADDPEWVARFSQEARTAAQVRHPGVVGVTDTGTDGHVGPFTVSELVDGPSLRTVLDRQGPLAPAEAASVNPASTPIMGRESACTTAAK